ncbi:MAG: hypothetical protein ACPHN2_10315 [Sinimarinibacterium flocculans]|uniref:Uncharacterized protein n=1 Tax=Sinimarinibacterium flocculans TaxID=985250 RepID=A0A318EKC6_9GAMM|nr:hypothetical protein [Sinimarinibacterium flocculans]MEC9363574.1 hypothetical protein [Pseudomonadota bacterium]PXV71294.1 hypothetical protein C8D93_101339 [Sinimarinibacterium flocculans]
MKPGMKLKSAACDTEVMVVRGKDVVVDCGGAPMGPDKPATPAALDPGFANGSQIGKRYVDADGNVELLCTKPGKGSLSIGGVALQLKEAKPLPSSD